MGAFTDHILCIKPVSSKECPGLLWMRIIGYDTWAEVPPPQILVPLKYSILQHIMEEYVTC